MLVDTKTEASTSAPSYAAYKILHLGFIVLPVLGGLDANSAYDGSAPVRFRRLR